MKRFYAGIIPWIGFLGVTVDEPFRGLLIGTTSILDSSDNGTEFQFPTCLECDKNGEIRTKVYYCNPNSSWQKGMLEKNHEYIRYMIPKGTSLDPYTQGDAIKLMNHINSEARDSLNGCTPFRLSQLLLNNRLHKLLKLREIPADEVSLKPSLLKK